jgi:uncharacterized tellurite resistance protein B-like protein
MLDRIKAFFDESIKVAVDDPADKRATEIELAAAALLIEVARTDGGAGDVENHTVLESLRRAYALPDDALAELVCLAGEAAEDATDLYQFTRLVNDDYSFADKLTLVEDLWKVAFADGHLDRFEEQFIRRIAGLLHVSHADFIKTKLRAKDA